VLGLDGSGALGFVVIQKLCVGGETPLVASGMDPFTEWAFQLLAVAE
jgi:hypothetical protein